MDCTPFNVYESATHADWHEVVGRCVARLNLQIEGEPLFCASNEPSADACVRIWRLPRQRDDSRVSLLRYRIKNGNRRLRHTTWRKSGVFTKRFTFAKKYELRQIV